MSVPAVLLKRSQGEGCTEQGQDGAHSQPAMQCGQQEMDLAAGRLSTLLVAMMVICQIFCVVRQWHPDGIRSPGAISGDGCI